MGLWTITGGNRLYGTVTAQGSVNGALALLAGCLAVGGETVLERVPRVADVELMLEILRRMNCKVKREGDRVTVDSRAASMDVVPVALMSKLRASILFLGAMLGRFGAAVIPMPAGSVLGPRPVDLHLAALQTMGASLRLEDGMISCESCDLQGGEVLLPYPSVGATENAMLAACGCSGETILRGCAKEPEVVELAEYLSSAGLNIRGAGTDVIRVRREKCVGKMFHRMYADRIAASALLCAVGACGGKLILQEVISSHLQPTLDVLGEMGCNIKIHGSEIVLQSDGKLWSPMNPITTGPYPSFSTDVQPLLLAACLRADGVTVVRERVFGGRLSHAKQLRQFGGDVSLTEDCAVLVTGVPTLRGATVRIHDLWSGAAVLLAALQADGESCVVDDNCISRGFAHLDATLRQLGADLEFTD